jgi:preprotein translocase subunit SecE
MASNVVASGAKDPGDEKPSRPPVNIPSRPAGPGFFTIYKKGQGKWTRLGTVIAAGLVALFTMQFLYEQVRAYTTPATAWVPWIVDGVFLVVFALVLFFVVNKQNVVEFLIATDSEMKKVNWTTKAELIGSTKVVIFFMLIIMVLLFAFDTIFGYFFKLIHVLQVGPFGS